MTTCKKLQFQLGSALIGPFSLAPSDLQPLILVLPMGSSVTATGVNWNLQYVLR
jgi:hypothetical protein